MHRSSVKFYLLLVIIFSYHQNVFAQTKVIGYLPSYKGLINNIDDIDLDKLTHLNIAFLNPDKNGDLMLNDTMTCIFNDKGDRVSRSELETVISKAHQAGVKVLMSVAGALLPGCSGDWLTLLTPKNRIKLVDNLLKLVDDLQLDGLDIDLEGSLLTRIDNAGNYIPFIQALSSEFQNRHKLLTAATASYEGGMIPSSSLRYFDFVNIMSYDAIGPSWGTSEVEHSTYQQAIEHIEIWKKRGLTKDKLVLGLPFYGYGFGRYASNYSYKDIVTEFADDDIRNDSVGTACIKCNYITYNGTITIAVKTKLALQHGAGVMIWEITQDSHGEKSLLNVIDNEIRNFNRIKK